ncbi:DUF2911 domain-containing protein [Fulvivirgaceae bacterium BMA12]|uniref:DUF2911 domain-containing protein n=1 Tax=Agaribacillus aureus TaxID=3051825 RepID=A0ABT8KZT5_9BACT|nr:DUF2911 domain-containing protein [Fulvivirgaceae bacterium BMA12]
MKVKSVLSAGVLLFAIFFTAKTEAQTITTPRVASPAAEVSQTVGISKVTINYSRPSVKGREIWGKLVPYGFNNLGFGTSKAAPWRAGANENTIITFSHDAKIDGKEVPAGSYGYHVAVMENGEATIILSKNYSSWGSFFYDEKEDLLRVNVTTEEIPMTETLTFDFLQNSKNSTIAVLDWDKKRFPMTISFDTDDIVLANAKDQLRGVTGFGWQGPLSAANYCMQNNINHEQALKWVDKSIKANKNFQNVFVKASLLQQTGEKGNGMVMMDEAAQLANIGQLNFLGYQMLMKHKNYDKAIEYFKLNVKNNPEDANVYDSLGEAYKVSGQNKLAIKSLKKSLSLDPPANVKANSIKLLKELGVEDYAGTD